MRRDCVSSSLFNTFYHVHLVSDVHSHTVYCGDQVEGWMEAVKGER